ncbi:hypothetical protein, partial [Mesorhizobium sp. M4B.F.Ca.ET.215.01.1.1]|uniref:hypothetical protein n=1 Tax=Mesorhizobium sp. M4B.F.Ca.ET.215.01.1.1 TaxID=2563956 RepID=UPI001AEE2A26
DALHSRQTMSDGTDDAKACLSADKIVDFPEIFDGVLVLEATEIPQHRIGIQRGRQPPAYIGQAERGLSFSWSH